jgi:hypothetical protein
LPSLIGKGSIEIPNKGHLWTQVILFLSPNQLENAPHWACISLLLTTWLKYSAPLYKNASVSETLLDMVPALYGENSETEYVWVM